MAWNVDQIYSAVLKLIKKNQAGGLSASDFFYYWNIEQAQYHNDLIGRWEKGNNTKSGMNTGLVQNQTVLEDVAPFTIPVTISVAAGKAAKPVDFELRYSLRCNGKKVTVIRPDQLSYVNDSVIDAPSTGTNTYYAVEYEDYYLMLPNGVSSVNLDYVASPTDVVWAFTFDVNDRQVYDPVNSVQPKWAQDTIVTITKRSLNTLGIPFKDQDFINAGKSAQATGE
jgi:hypothetical protein